MSFDKDLPSAQQLERGDVNAFKRLLLAVKQLQDDATPFSGLVSAGIARKADNGTIFNPNADDENPFDNTDNTKPGTPTGLTATATAGIAFLQWVIPNFQPVLSHSEVWILSAPAFREDINYAIGDFVTYSSTVYKFTTAHTAAVWDATDVTAAGAGDLVIANAKERYETPIGSGLIPIDLVGGTAYCWVRLISFSGVAGDFSSRVTATGKSMPGAIPVGVEVMAQASPGSEWLELNGQTVNRADYPLLFAWANGAGIVFVEAAKLASQYGDGNAVSTFSLPDTRGRNPVSKAAAGTFSTIGAVGGAETVTLATTDIPSHTHTPTDGGHSHGLTDGGHSHGVTDPNHTHGVTDPGHVHQQRVDTGSLLLGSAGSMGSDNADDAGAGNTASATTGLTVNSASTGVTVNSATTGATVNSATTGITIGNTGGGGAHANLAPYYVTRVWVRAKL